MANVFRARHLAGVELEIGQHPVEDLAGVVDGEEIEIDAVRLHAAGVEREHAIIEPASERDWNSRHAFPGYPLSSPAKAGTHDLFRCCCVATPATIACTRRMGPRLRGDDRH